MAGLEHQVRTSQHRLWVNRWLRYASWSTAVAGGIFAATVLIGRLYDAPIPFVWVGVGLLGVSLLGPLISTVLRRESAATAATRLDEAAGLRERLSSAHYCLDDADPFAQAVVADAERISTSLSVKQHIRLVVPPAFAFTAVTFVIAAMMFLIPSGLLASSAAAEEIEQNAELSQTQLAVKKQMDRVRTMVESRPELKDLKEELTKADKKAGGQLTRPVDIRREAVKKIDTLADAIKKKRQNAKYNTARDTRKLLRNLTSPKSPGAPTRKLTRALAKGDFKSAREEIKALKEQLATLKSEKDREFAARIGKQLDALAKQLENAAKNENLAKKLQQAGLDKDQVKKLMEKLSDKDIEQIKQKLEEKGLSQAAIDKLAKQLKRQQQAGNATKKLAQAMKQAATGSSPGQMMDGLQMAAGQLSDLEMVELEMGELDAAMATLQDSRSQIDKPCGRCRGSGCQQCEGRGQGMGKLGKGRGGMAPEQQTAVRFKTERGKVKTGRGAIIGQFEFEGEQVKGEVTTEFTELLSASEHDASDRINRNRIPRQYQKAVREYFSNVQRAVRSAKTIKLSTPDADSASDVTEPSPTQDDGE